MRLRILDKGEQQRLRYAVQFQSQQFGGWVQTGMYATLEEADAALDKQVIDLRKAGGLTIVREVEV